MDITPIEASIFEQFPEETKELMLASGVLPVLDPFMKLYERDPETDLIICIGGRGGGKTHEVSKFSVVDATSNNRRQAILRDEKEAIRESILNEIFMRYDEAINNGHVEENKFEKIASGLRKKGTPEMMIFTKGFRASSTQKKTNLKGVSDTDTAIIEEAEDIRDYAKFNTFRDSIRTKDRLIIIMLNTPDIKHWVVKRYFDLEPVMDEAGEIEDGYYKLNPKPIKGVEVIQTSYLDNPYLPAGIVRDYMGSGDPTSERYDKHYYLTEICGYASTGKKGQILKKVKPITLEEYMALPYRELYGQDFGTASPAGLVGVKIHRNKSWCRQLNYDPLPVLEIGKLYCRLKFNIADEITADNAEPKSIKKLRDGWNIEELDADTFEKFPELAIGWNVKGCVKGTDSVNFGLDYMVGMELYAVNESEELWEEIINYTRDQDKWGNYTGDPIDKFNHLIDPWRYVINRHRGRGQQQ